MARVKQKRAESPISPQPWAARLCRLPKQEHPGYKVFTDKYVFIFIYEQQFIGGYGKSQTKAG